MPLEGLKSKDLRLRFAYLLLLFVSHSTNNKSREGDNQKAKECFVHPLERLTLVWGGRLSNLEFRALGCRNTTRAKKVVKSGQERGIWLLYHGGFPAIRAGPGEDRSLEHLSH